MGNTEKLITTVQKYPILYDQSRLDYKNIRAKDKIWTEIGKEFNESGEELKKKWKNLRDTYAKYIKNTKRKTGQAETKTKAWVWAHRMEAFRPFLTFKSKIISNVSEITFPPSTSESVAGGVADDDFVAENIQSHSENNSVEGATEADDKNSSSRSPHSTPLILGLTDVATPTASKVPTEQKIASQSAPSFGDMIEYFENKWKIEHDAVDSLMLAHAKTIKTFSGRRQIITKMKIAQVIMEQELLHQKELDSSTQRNSAVSRPESTHGVVGGVKSKIVRSL